VFNKGIIANHTHGPIIEINVVSQLLEPLRTILDAAPGLKKIEDQVLMVQVRPEIHNIRRLRIGLLDSSLGDIENRVECPLLFRAGRLTDLLLDPSSGLSISTDIIAEVKRIVI
jgi:hypothetical protein